MEKRHISVTELFIDKLLLIEEPKLTALEQYHNENKDKFTQPELRNIQYIDLSTADYARQVVISEADLFSLFEARKNEFAIKESRNVLQMVIDSEIGAASARKRLSAGEQFIVVAKEVAGQELESIDLGKVEITDLPIELSKAVFSLSEGQTSDPIKGPFGWHIFKVKTINQARKANLDDAKEQLTRELQDEKAAENVYLIANKLEDTLGSGETLKSSAKALNLKLKSIPSIDHLGRDSKGNVIKNLPAHPFLETVFSSSIDEKGTLIETNDSSFFILHVNSISPSYIPVLKEVKSQVITAWKNKRRIEFTRKRAEEIAKLLADGISIKDIPGSHGKLLPYPIPVTRNSDPNQIGIPSKLIDQIFQLKRIGKTTISLIGNRFIIARLDKIQSPKAGKNAESFENFANQLKSEISQDIISQYNKALQKNFEVTVNNEMVEKLFSEEYSQSGK